MPYGAPAGRRSDSTGDGWRSAKVPGVFRNDGRASAAPPGPAPPIGARGRSRKSVRVPAALEFSLGSARLADRKGVVSPGHDTSVRAWRSERSLCWRAHSAMPSRSRWRHSQRLRECRHGRSHISAKRRTSGVALGWLCDERGAEAWCEGRGLRARQRPEGSGLRPASRASRGLQQLTGGRGPGRIRTCDNTVMSGAF
jgi:hypothetical protein